MSKVVKTMMIEDLRKRVGDTRDFLVVDAAKLDAVTTHKLRLSLKKQNIQALVVPNKLALRALKDIGVTGLDEFLAGPSTLVWGGQDIVALSKEITKWAAEIEPLEIKGGTVEGTAVNREQVEELSRSPSREELIGMVVGLILAPGARLAGALLGPGGTICGQIKSKGDGEGAPAADAADTAAAS